METRIRKSTRRTAGPNVLSLLLVCLLLVNVPANVSAQDRESIQTLQRLGKALASVAENDSPSVVGIKASWTETQSSRGMQGLPFGEDFFDFFQRPSPRQQPQQQQPQREFQRRAQGSGFIISTDGYILTNNHVVSQAEELEVELRDGRTLKAEVIGTDPESDVAVIQVKGENLRPLPLADSEEVEVGEWVLAIGNPLGLTHTVTAGIVSAKGRTGVHIATYENFIQTDAAINFGNSGGPLINLYGQAIGINTAIAGPGGNIGIGFAIPINMAKNIANQLIETGGVERGYLGVLPQDVTPEMADAFGLDEAEGVAIAEVTEGSAAEEAGLQHNDVLLTLDGETLDSAAELRNLVAQREPGSKVRFVLLRNGKRRTITVTLDKRPSMAQLRGRRGGGRTPSDTAKSEALGLTLQNLTSELAERFGHEDAAGVIVTRVAPGSSAAQKGIRPGHLVKEVNLEPVKNVSQFEEALEKASDKGRALLLISDGQAQQFVSLDIPED